MEFNFENVAFNFFPMQPSEPFNLKVSKTNENGVYYYVFTGESSKQLLDCNGNELNCSFDENDFSFVLGPSARRVTFKLDNEHDFRRFGKLFESDRTKIKTESEISNSLGYGAFFKQELKHNAFESKAGSNLKDVLEKMIKTYRHRAGYYFPPYTTLAQSSGFGKTRQIEALSHEWFVVYCNLNGEDANSIPQRSKLSDFLIYDFSIRTEIDLAARFEAYYYFFLEKITKIIDSGKNLAEEKKRLFMQLSRNQNIDEIEKTLSENYKFYWEKLTAYSSESFKRLHYFSLDSNEQIIFVFDNANELYKKQLNNSTKYIQLVRKQLELCMRDFFVILIDEPKNLSYFMLDRELEKIMPTKYSLIDFFSSESFDLDLVYLLPTWDLFSNYDQINLEQVQDPFNLFSYGRPLWGAYFNQIKNLTDKNDQVNEIEQLVLLAERKLKCGKELLELEQNKESEFYIALIGCRAQISVDPQSISAKNLISSFMAICFSVDKRRRSTQMSYSSEPILAEASARLCASLKYDKVIERFCSFVNNGVINESSMGQLVAKIILLICNDRAFEPATEEKKDYYQYTKALKVEHFLKVLMGQDNCTKFNETYKNIESYEKLMNSTVFFNHFMQIDETPSKVLLQKLFKRCAACICKTNQKYVDLIIPVLIDENDLSKMSYIFIKVKNHSNPSRIVLSKLHFLNPISIMGVDDKFPFISLYVQPGSQETDKSSTFFLSSQLENDISEVIGLQEVNRAEMKTYNQEIASYNQNFQIGVILLGINQINYSFLQNEEIEQLIKLAQEKAEFGKNLSSFEHNLVDEILFLR